MTRKLSLKVNFTQAYRSVQQHVLITTAKELWRHNEMSHSREVKDTVDETLHSCFYVLVIGNKIRGDRPMGQHHHVMKLNKQFRTYPVE